MQAAGRPETPDHAREIHALFIHDRQSIKRFIRNHCIFLLTEVISCSLRVPAQCAALPECFAVPQILPSPP